MIPRELEPELMDSVEEAVDYDAMDHRAVNCSFVDDFLTAAAAHSILIARPDENASITILDVGTGTAILPEVTIGEWTVIGAGAVVTESLPGNATAVGVPARVIKTRAEGWWRSDPPGSTVGVEPPATP